MKAAFRWPSRLKRRRLCAWSGTAALLIQLLLPLMLGMPAASAPGAAGEPAVIGYCDLLGAKAEPLKDGGPASDNPFSSCPVCQQFRSISQNFLIAQPAALAIPLDSAFVWRQPGEAAAAAVRKTGVRHPRAPPAAS